MRSSAFGDSVALGPALRSSVGSDNNTEGWRPARENARRRTPIGMNPVREKKEREHNRRCVRKGYKIGSFA
jgi:hypothetical protein